MSLLYALSISLIEKDKLKVVLAWGFILLGLGLSIVIGNLVVNESWPIGLGLILALPGLILLYRYPLVSLIIWLLLIPFLLENPGLRTLYWVIHRALPPFTIGIIVISRRKLPHLGWVEVAMAGYAGVSLLSIIFLNNDMMATIYQFYDRVLIPMCLYLLVRLATPNEKDLQWLLPIFSFILISQSVIGLLSWTAPQLIPSIWHERLGSRTVGSLGSYSVFSSTVMFCGLFILHSGLNQKPGVKRIWYVSLFSLSLFMVFLSFSRGSWLAGMVVILGLSYLYPKFMLRYSLLTIPLIIIVISGGLLSYYLSWASHRFYSEQSSEEAISRLPIFYASYKMFEAKPLLGWGYGNFDRFDREFQGRVFDLINADKDHASHNVYLTLLAEQGLIGSSLFLAPVFWWLLLTLKVWSKMLIHGFLNRNLVFIFWLVILFHLIVNNFSNMRVVFGLGMWWITLGLIASIVYTYLRPELKKIRSYSERVT